MKTITELLEWSVGAAKELGDASAAVGQIFARYNQLESETPDITFWMPHVEDPHELMLRLPYGEQLALKINPMGPTVIQVDDGFSPLASEALDAFGITKVVDGVWYLTPSLFVPELLHVFVVLYDVPTPAPWEADEPARIIL